jgi:hypothetical protein
MLQTENARSGCSRRQTFSFRYIAGRFDVTFLAFTRVNPSEGKAAQEGDNTEKVLREAVLIVAGD